MPEHIIEAFDALGKEIGALKKELEYKVMEIDLLKDKNKALYERAENLEKELKAAEEKLYKLRQPCQEVSRNA